MKQSWNLNEKEIRTLQCNAISERLKKGFNVYLIFNDRVILYILYKITEPFFWRRPVIFGRHISSNFVGTI